MRNTVTSVYSCLVYQMPVLEEVCVRLLEISFYLFSRNIIKTEPVLNYSLKLEMSERSLKLIVAVVTVGINHQRCMF